MALYKCPNKAGDILNRVCVMTGPTRIGDHKLDRKSLRESAYALRPPRTAE